MSLYILDTDSLTLLHAGHPQVRQRYSLIEAADVAITVISVEEQLDGWYIRLRRPHRSRAELASVYSSLSNAVTFLGQFEILSFTEPAIERFEQLRGMRLNVGAYDLRIAAIVLENDGTVVTRNLCDFQRVPNLTVENWAA
jgi:tRNA(fMet)-specific endonuclease VapC